VLLEVSLGVSPKAIGSTNTPMKEAPARNPETV
jgi:hypothetical protein